MDLENFFNSLLSNAQKSGPQIAQSIPLAQYYSDANQYQKPANNIAGAMTDLNNPLYQQLYGQFKQQGQSNLAQTIAQLSGQNRKLSMMGRASLLDPERGGEQLFRGLTQGYQDVQNNASGQALKQIDSAYKPAQEQGLWQQQNALKKSQATGDVFGTLAKLFGL